MANLGRLIMLVNLNTGSRHPLNGCKPSETLSHLPRFNALRKYTSGELPAAVDLRVFMTPVEDQEDMNSCVGNAVAAIYEFLVMKNTGKHIDVSRLFIYYNARLKDGLDESNMKDDGAFITGAIEGLKEFGCCKEQSFPYKKSNVNKKPLPNCYEEAKAYRVTEGTQVKADLDEMKACLAQGHPFVFGLMLFESFSDAETNDGRVPMPDNEYEAQREVHGWHALLAVGYSDRSQCFIIRNSWGANWGDHGYCYIPYKYMSNPTFCQDVHTVCTISDDHRNVTENKNPNTFDWEKQKFCPFVFPTSYSSTFFNDRWFWKPDDPHDYSTVASIKGVGDLAAQYKPFDRRRSGRIEAQ